LGDELATCGRSHALLTNIDGCNLVAAPKINLRRRVDLWLGIGVILSLASCSKDNRPPLVPVQGQVFLEDRPAHKAVVWFHPVEQVELGCPHPRGVVDQQGEFVVGTYKIGDGAPAGRYRISVYWRTPAKSGDEAGETLIPYRYMDPAQSGLPEVEVDQDPIILPAFRLKAR
jgi:hypothetical protein